MIDKIPPFRRYTTRRRSSQSPSPLTTRVRYVAPRSLPRPVPTTTGLRRSLPRSLPTPPALRRSPLSRFPVARALGLRIANSHEIKRIALEHPPGKERRSRLMSNRLQLSSDAFSLSVGRAHKLAYTYSTLSLSRGSVRCGWFRFLRRGTTDLGLALTPLAKLAHIQEAAWGGST